MARKLRLHSAAQLERMKKKGRRKRKQGNWLRETGQTKCHYCGKECGNRITHDHKKPLSKGGYNGRKNAVPACRDCNNRKGSMDYDDFIKSIPQPKQTIPHT